MTRPWLWDFWRGAAECVLRLLSSAASTTCSPWFENTLKLGIALLTDALKSYIGLDNYYEHEVIDHAVEYVRGKVHTNTIENFWSLVKRQLHGTYISVEPFHLYRYLDEQMFRFNNRKDMNDSQRFELGMSQVLGKRLTYSELTGKDESPRHETTGTRETEAPF